MKISRRLIREMREEVREGPYRSPLFWWMVKHHDALLAEGNEGRMPWQRLCRRFAEQGVIDGSGQSPTVARAGKTWRDVERWLAERPEQSRRQEPQRSRPRPAEWQPSPATSRQAAHPTQPAEQVHHPPPARSAPMAPPVSAAASGAKPTLRIEDLPPEARAEFEKLDRGLAEFDRKRFRIR